MRLKDKVCIITGSSRGIGAAIARGFAVEGANVIITYNQRKEMALKVANEIGSELVLEMEVRDRMSVRKAFEKVADHYGHINVLVNNAGINRTADFSKQTDEEWNEIGRASCRERV